ncbi:MAG: hypothetical protein KF832_11800 [Caldilineaceae bacterium]|nr:hypothetical protein [Caldilineaceae bacterium]
MNIFKRIANFFLGGGGANGSNRYFPIYVLSRRCREPLTGQVDLLNELSLDENDENTFYTRKVLHTTGRTRCFDQVEVLIWFSKDKRLLRQEVWGGEWLDAEAYERAEVEFQARLEAAEAAKDETAE